MSQAPARINLLGLDHAAMQGFFAGIGEKPFRAGQVMKWIHHRHVTDFDAMTDLGRDLRAKLGELAEVRPPQIIYEKQSEDGTRKWLLGCEAGNAVEAVYIPEPNRGTLCVSSQVGCGLNCTFCSTATQGFNRNLTAAEVIGQVFVAARALGNVPHGTRRLTNVVMMGMGEPLLNFDNVVPAMSIMRDDFGYGLASRRVTLSTAGLVPMIDRLAAESDVALAVSLHAPDDELRSQLVPLNRKYPIAELMAACQRYVKARPKTTITFEYTLMRGINDQPQHARALARLVRRVPSKVNLIPFNPFPGTAYERADDDAIDAFHRIVNGAGVLATVRRTRGDDIDAACGQLKGQVQDRTRRQAAFRASLDKGVSHAA